jgi:hypothetical protein
MLFVLARSGPSISPVLLPELLNHIGFFPRARSRPTIFFHVIPHSRLSISFSIGSTSFHWVDPVAAAQRPQPQRSFPEGDPSRDIVATFSLGA